MTAGTGLGIAGLIIAIIGAFMPVIGLYVGWFALLIVSIAALLGERGLTIATVILSVMAFIFLTPSLWVGEGVRALGAGVPVQAPPRILLPISIVMLVAPFVCMIIGKKPSSGNVRI